MEEQRIIQELRKILKVEREKIVEKVKELKSGK